MYLSTKQHGFEGILLPGDGRMDKVMIVMSGSNGGMKLTRQCAEFYHANGVPALALALFATHGTQTDLDRVPLEYVENAILWLKKQGYKKIGIDGMSKGSELALIAASRFDALSCVIVRVPSHFVSEGLIVKGKSKNPSGTSCWSYQGKELPFALYRSRVFNIPAMLLKWKEMHIIDFNRDKDVTPDSIIPIEQIKAPILMLSSTQDTVWPSFDSASWMEEHLTAAGFAYPHRHVAFTYMSHAMLTKLPFLYRIAFKTERQHPQICREEREQLKQELLDWIDSVWA